MKILAIGTNGQVARSLKTVLGNETDIELVFTSRAHFDLSSPENAHQVVLETKPDILINAAAYTLVDHAEDEPELAMRINGEAPGCLAAAATEVGAKFIHLSTDYVFDGSSDHAYDETVLVNPIGVYGRTKFAGEERVRAASGQHLILRTAWLFSPYRKNFLKTMVGLAEVRDEVQIVSDQHGNPTSALDVARAIRAVVQAEMAGVARWGETFHFAGADAMAWDEFGRRIFAECSERNMATAMVRSIPTSDYPTKAMRPANSRLDSNRFANAFGFQAQPIDKAISEVFDLLIK